MRLRPVYNSRLGQWKLCHDQWCKHGETSVVAVIPSSMDDDADKRMAETLAERWNMVEDALGESR